MGMGLLRRSYLSGRRSIRGNNGLGCGMFHLKGLVRKPRLAVIVRKRHAYSVLQALFESSFKVRQLSHSHLDVLLTEIRTFDQTINLLPKAVEKGIVRTLCCVYIFIEVSADETHHDAPAVESLI